MDEDFKQALQWVFKAEGGLSNDPLDKGGATKYGVSLRFLTQHDNGDIDGDGDVDQFDIQALSKAQAAEYYRLDFWDVCRCNQMPRQLAIIVFDHAVNSGTGTAARLLQRHVGAKVDGAIGPKTIANTLTKYNRNPDWFIASYLSRRAVYYRDVVLADPTAEYFLKGWLNRLFLLQQFITNRA